MNPLPSPVQDASPAPLAASSDEQRAVLRSLDTYLARGLDLKRWWDRAYASNSFAEKFPLTVSFNRPDTSFGFFDVAQVEGRPMPIMGNFQSLLYDQPKTPGVDQRQAARFMRDQLRRFVLRYFMRVSSFRQPEAYVPREDRGELPVLLRPLSWCPDPNPSNVGFGFKQLYYKETASGEVRPFPPAEGSAIVDLRRIGPEFAWIQPFVTIFDFKFLIQPFGAGTPSLVLPLDEGSNLVINRDFVIDEDEPSPNLLGRYGFGYAFIKNPEAGLLAYGPGEFEAAFEIIQFEVDRKGRIRANAIFVANRPRRVANVPLNPLSLGYEMADLLTSGTSRPLLRPFKRFWEALPGGQLSFDPARLFITSANLLTGGLAASKFCISYEQLEKDFLVLHFQQHYQTLVGSLETWRQIPDWLANEDELPRWVVTGRSSA